MAILHGSWIPQSLTDDDSGYFFVWGETWRRIDPVAIADDVAHPFVMAEPELQDWLRSLQGKSLNWSVAEFPLEPIGKKRKTASTRWQALSFSVPSEVSSEVSDTAALPLLSGAEIAAENLELLPWQVTGVRLTAMEAVQFLQSLPLSSMLDDQQFWMGSDLRFWSHVTRWHLDLLARGKFLPILAESQMQWRVLLDSGVDQGHFDRLTRQMPLCCRSYGYRYSDSAPEKTPEATPEEIAEDITASALILDFLNGVVGERVRAIAAQTPLPSATFPKDLPLREWMQSLGGKGTLLQNSRFATTLNQWVAPLQRQLTQPAAFRTCFYLNPPAPGQGEWILEYFLQAIDDPEFLVGARTVWNNPVDRLKYMGRTIEQPQESLLAGLGLASRLYPLLEPSLQVQQPQSCRLNPMQVYDFLKSIAWRLQDSGFGVVLPPSLANQEGWANRLGLRVQAEAPKLKQNQRLGLQSLLNFKWELTIGGQRLSKAEFDRLVALNQPLVEVNGEWVELRQQDVRAAQTFFESRKDQMALSLEDALRISTGDTQMVEKLPVVGFEASGALQELINALTSGNQNVEAIAIPETFQGELRPYQLRGASWLAFLERWGLGACLADDMGLGKCLAPHSQVMVNGELRTAESIWQSFADEDNVEFDGEGFWATPTVDLWVNAIDEKTGKITVAPVRKIYRQQVRERLRTIKLQDGHEITITQRHQLLTHQGWSNQFKAGDYACVPAKLIWHGNPEDQELAKFLAWQIAEGYERYDCARVFISQKNLDCLEDLRQTLENLSQRYGFNINHPRLSTYPDKTPALIITSRQYQQFLESKGYHWGNLSAEKVLPPFIMQADLDTIRVFLRHYFEAEGSVIISMRSVEIATASKVMIQQLSNLLRRFGIWLRIVAKQKRATNGSGIYRTYYIGTFGGSSIRRFLEEIGFVSPAQQQQLEKICEFVCNTNVESIPASGLVMQLVHSSQLPIRHFGMYNTVYINGTRQFSRTSLEKVVAGCHQVVSGEAEPSHRALKPSRWTNKTLAAYAQLDRKQVQTVQHQLQKLLDLDQEVFYCQIESVEEQHYEGWVYDFEIAEHHNFVANQILCHNTIQLIVLMLHLKEEKVLEHPTLLVCPTSVLGNWEREVKKFAPSLKVLLHHGDRRPQGKSFAKSVKGQDLVITSYSLVHRDVKDLQTVTWQGVVLDEAQNIKNAEAKQSQAVRQLETQFRIALTGTPVENRLAELWSILDFLNPGYLGPRNFFQRRFAVPIERYGDTASLQTLRSLVQPFILRRLKTDRSIIQDLPDKQEMTVFCGLTAEQAALYQKLVDQSLVDIESAEGIQRHGLILALLVRLKQVCNHPILLKEQENGSLRLHSGKLQRLEEMLEELLAEGDRCLIFTQFAEWGKLLQTYLQQRFEREVLYLYGSTSKKQREEMVDRFQNDPQAPRIFILSLKAGGVGLNLTRASHVFHFDRWWNPAVENQATDRVFRIGQTRNVQVHKFICTGTLEERIHELIESKKALSEQVVGAGESWLTELGTDQLRNLLLLDRTAVIDDGD